MAIPCMATSCHTLTMATQLVQRVNGCCDCVVHAWVDLQSCVLPDSDASTNQEGG